MFFCLFALTLQPKTDKRARKKANRLQDDTEITIYRISKRTFPETAKQLPVCRYSQEGERLQGDAPEG